MTTKDDIGCDTARAWMEAYLDSELDMAHAGLLNAHLNICSECAALSKTEGDFLHALHEHAPRFEMPADFENTITAVINAEHPATTRTKRSAQRWSEWSHWFAPAFGGAVIAVILTLYVFAPTSSDKLADEVISSHVRSLQGDHLTDVLSSDKHTVKPWFTGKLDFSPPVADYADQGFTLIGGRLDYLDHQNVASLSYRHGKHIINVFVMPVETREIPLNQKYLRGYNVVSWTRNGMTFYAVSDMSMEELKRLSDLLNRN
jgi:anti-sigma factor RsiW